MFRSKYENPYINENSIDNVLMAGEQVIWSGKPKRNAFIINKSMVMMPFALLWLLIDGGFIVGMVASGEIGEMLFFIIPFFAIHLMPVWIWLSNVLTANKKWKNTEYAITDKRIIIKGGFVGYDIKSIYYTEINTVDLRVGVIDKMLGVGDIHIIENGIITGKNASMPSILDIENPIEVFKTVQKTVIDIQTDIHYPNGLRPDENPGYNTRYMG